MKQVQPSVVVGLGGTGVSTITFLKKALEEQAPDLKEFVRFLAIDSAVATSRTSSCPRPRSSLSSVPI